MTSINKVILKINQGHFSTGYAGITCQNEEFSLLSNKALREKLCLWNHCYKTMMEKDFGEDIRGMRDIDEVILLAEQKTLNQIKECRSAATNLIISFNEWLQESNIFGNDKNPLSKEKENLVIIQTKYQELWQLPWHEWKLIKDIYPNTEVIFSLPGKVSSCTGGKHIPQKVRLLPVIGNDTGIELDEVNTLDKMKSNPDMQVESPMKQPGNEELDKMMRKGWDIFSFLGHSKIENNEVKLELDDKERSISIHDISEALRRSGIRIAIFNSCDNLRIAFELKEISMSFPYSILMSKKVPNAVAVTFFNSFIEAYRAGKSFYQSVREARGKLQQLENEKYPCATWLPIIVQDNAVDLAPTWNELSRYISTKKRIGVGVGIGTLAMIAIALIRFFGLLQAPELFIFDTMMRSRPSEEIDKHILIIENKGKKSNLHQSLSNDLLNKFLVRLENSKDSQPKVVGLDNYLDDKEKRDPNEHKQLISDIKDGRLVLVCKKNNNNDSSIDPKDAISAPSDSIVGFSDVVRDGNTDNDWIRRHLFKGEKEDFGCETDFSLSYVLANIYFDDNLDSELSLPSPNQVKLDNLVDARLISNNRGLYKINNISLDRGKQIFLNYRYNNSTIKPFQTKNIEELLKESDKEFQRLVKQKIILIGTTDSGRDPRFGDEVQTPYGPMRGIYLQAHMTSQLVNAVTENRALIWANDLGDLLIIWVLSAVGGIAIAMMYERSIKSICLSGGASILIMMPLLSAPFLLIFTGYLFPLVPVAASLLSTGILVGLCLNNPTTLKKVQNLSLPSK